VAALGHGGGLDRQHGGYHCHQGGYAGQSFSSKSEMLRSVNPEQNIAADLCNTDITQTGEVSGQRNTTGGGLAGEKDK